MAILPHIEARTRFLHALERVLTDGCRAWQRAKEGWTSDEVRNGGRRLRLTSFLKSECDDATYKLWMSLSKAVGEPEAIWIHSTRAFEQCMVRLKRADQRNSGCFGREKLAWLEDEFRAFWDVEKVWIGRFNSAKRWRSNPVVEAVEDYASKGQGLDALCSDLLGLYEKEVLTTFEGNKYELAWNNSCAIANKLVEIKLQGEIGYLVGEILFDNYVIGQMLRKKREALHCVSAAADRAVDFGNLFECLDIVLDDIECSHSLRMPSPDFWGLNVYRHFKFMMARDNRRIRGQGIATSNFMPVLLSWIINRRSELLRTLPNVDSAHKIVAVALYEYLCNLHGAATSPLEEDFALVLTEGIVKRPEEYIALEISSIVGGFGSEMKNRVHYDVMMARRWLSHRDSNFDKAGQWIARSIADLGDCQTYILWENIYALVSEYWTRKGLPLLADRCL